MRSFFLFVMLFSSIVHTYAQQINGEVILEGRTSARGTVISLENSAGKTIDYQVLDNDSTWQLQAKQAGEYYLRVYHLSYERFDSLLTLDESKKQFITIRLKPNNFELSGVEIIGQRMAIEQRGDTVSYTVNAFKSEGDTNLEDVLQKMPGVEVTDDHQIRYKGKKVNVLLIEGHNVLNNQHQLVAEGVDLEAVRSVEFIENYKTEMEKGGVGESNQTAMNVKLKKEAKGKTNGDIQATVGYKNKYEVNGNILHYQPKSTYTIFARNNNLTEPILTTTDYLNLQTSILDMLNQHQGGDIGRSVDILPTELSLNDDIYKSNDGLLAGNWSLHLGKKTKLRSSILLLRTDHQTQKEINRFYYNDGSIFLGNMDYKQLALMGDFKVALEHKVDSSKILAVKVDYHLKDKQLKELQRISPNGESAQKELLQQINNNRQHQNLFIKAKLNHQKSNQVNLKYGISYLQNTPINDYLIQGSDSIYSLPQLSNDSLYQYNQSLSNTNKLLNANIEVHHNHSQFPRVLKLNSSWQKEQTKGTFLFPQENGNQQRISKLIDLELQQVYKRKHISLSLSANVNYKHLLQGQQTFAYPSINPKLGIAYYFSTRNQGNKISLNYGFKNTNTSFNQSNQLAIIQHPQTIQINALPLDQIMRTQFANLYLYYSSFQSSTQPSLMLGVNYSHTKQAITDVLTNNENYWTQQALFIPNRQNINTYLTTSLKISPHLRWRISTKYLSLKSFYYNLITNSINPFNNQSITTQNNIDISLFKKKLNLDLNYHFLYQKNNITRSLQQHKIGLDTKIGLLKRKLIIQTAFQYHLNKLANNTNNYWEMEAQASFRLSKKWHITAKTARMNRFQPRTITNFEVNDNYFQTQTFNATEAYAITGLKYKF